MSLEDPSVAKGLKSSYIATDFYSVVLNLSEHKANILSETDMNLEFLYSEFFRGL